MLSRQNLEFQARKFLESLHGYLHRQEWQKTDLKFTADLLQEWDEQVTKLVQERDRLSQYCAELEELNRRNEWRLSGRGFGHYFKFLIGFEPWPSR